MRCGGGLPFACVGLVTALLLSGCGEDAPRRPSTGSSTDAGRQLTVGEACNAAGFLGQGKGAQVPFSLSAAVPDHGPLSCAGGMTGPDLAFVWTAADAGPTSFEVQGGAATDDLVVEVFRSSLCDAGASVGCDDDGGADLSPRVQIDAQAGRTYYVVVSAKGAAPAGSFSLVVR